METQSEGTTSAPAGRRGGGVSPAPYSVSRFKRTAGEAFKGADYATAWWPHEPEPVSLWDAICYWAAVLLCVGAFALYHGCAGPSDIDAERASAASHQDAIEQARAEAIAIKQATRVLNGEDD